MKKLSILIVVSILSFIVSDSFAQRGMKWRGSGGWGWGMGSQYNRMYDPKTVGDHKRRGDQRRHDYSDERNVSRCAFDIKNLLGPWWYIENRDIRIEPKDKIEVAGSRITY